MADIETLVSQVFPYVKDAVSAYGQSVLTKSEDAAASGTVRHGQRLLAAILNRGKRTPQIESAVTKLARTPEDPVAADELRDQIRQTLREDPSLARDLTNINTHIRSSSATVYGHHSVGVGGDHQGPIHLGDNTSNLHHNVHHTVHNNIQERRISGLSIATLVLGLLGFLILPIPVAIVIGLMALTRMLRSSSPAQTPGADQSGHAATGSQAPPHTAGSQESMAGTTPGHAAGGAPPPPAPADTAGSTWPGTDSSASPPDGSMGQAVPPSTGTAPGTGPGTPRPSEQFTPNGPTNQPGPTADMFAPPTPRAAAANTPFTPPAAGAPVPFVPAAGSGFAAAKAISIVFALIGILAAGMWGLGWTAAIAIVYTEAESGSYTAEGTDPSLPNTGLPDSGGEGGAPSPVDLCEPSPGYATVCTLETGDCFIDPPTSEFYEVELTSCDEPHNAQVIGSYSPSQGDWPGTASFTADIESTCSPMSERTLDPTRAPDAYYVGYIAPNEESWDYGIQEAFCYVAADGESWTTSLLL